MNRVPDPPTLGHGSRAGDVSRVSAGQGRVPTVSQPCPGHTVTPCPPLYRGTPGNTPQETPLTVSRREIAAYTSGVLRARAAYYADTQPETE